MMSLLNLLLSRKEVILSLVAIGLILFIIVMLVVAPVLQRSWKKRMVRQRTQKAVRIARTKKNKNRNNPQRANAAPRKRPVEVAVEQIVPAEDAVTGTPDESPRMSPAESTTVEETPIKISSSLQDVLDSVFVDDEANSRFEVLLNGIEPISAEELKGLAVSVASELAARAAQGSLS